MIMRILMILPNYPIPTDSGEKRRILAFLQGMSRRHRVVAASLGDERYSNLWAGDSRAWESCIVPHRFRKAVPAVRSFLSSRTYRETKFSNPALKNLISELLEDNDFDVVWVSFLNMTVYLDEHLKKWSTTPRSRPVLLLDQHNVDDHYWESFRQYIKNPFYRVFCSREAIKNRRLQESYFPCFDLMLSVSEEDKKLTEQYGIASGDVLLAPNGVDVDYFKPVCRDDKNSSPTLVFGGSLDVTMNQDGILWFIREVFPIVKKRVPGVQLIVVGRNPAKSILAKAGSSIKVVADPPDIRDYYKRADVFIVPLRSGGGTKLKTIEAMAMALPVVSTSAGVQGLNVISGEHVYVADDPGIFAVKITEFLSNSIKAEEIALNARKFVEENFSWESIVRNVEDRLTAEVRSRGFN